MGSYFHVCICAEFSLRPMKYQIPLIALHHKITVTKSNTPPWVFSHFLNCTNGTKSCKASHLLHGLSPCAKSDGIEMFSFLEVTL